MEAEARLLALFDQGGAAAAVAAAAAGGREARTGRPRPTADGLRGVHNSGLPVTARFRPADELVAELLARIREAYELALAQASPA